VGDLRATFAVVATWWRSRGSGPLNSPIWSHTRYPPVAPATQSAATPSLAAPKPASDPPAVTAPVPPAVAAAPATPTLAAAALSPESQNGKSRPSTRPSAPKRCTTSGSTVGGSGSSAPTPRATRHALELTRGVRARRAVGQMAAHAL
jgi:hypothetical protein